MKLLAFDTSTERLHLGASADGRMLIQNQPGGAQSSARLLPLALDMLLELRLKLSQLDAIVVGRGPGSFTGVRTACAVAQGLAYGAGVPVLPIDTLWAVAEQARQGRAEIRVLSLIDARMGQFYAAAWKYHQGLWTQAHDNTLLGPDNPVIAADWWADGQPLTLAGVGIDPLPTWLTDRFPASIERLPAEPGAAALLRLAEQAWAAGQSQNPAQLEPLYVRDKVAQTQTERAAQSAQSAQSAP